MSSKLLPFLPVLAAGCTSIDLSQSFELDRLRVLAVAAEPAEPRPGDDVTFTSLVVSPARAVGLTTWFVCADLTSCSPDADLMGSLTGDPAEMTPEEQAALFAELQAQGLIGVEPYYSPRWTVPDDYLDGLTDEQKLEGTTAVVTVTAIPTAEGDTAALDTDEAEVEVGYKRVPVSLATTPNHNPSFAGVRIDGIDIAPGATVTLARGQTYDIEVVLADDAVEDYDYVNTDGAAEVRTEEPYFSWYLQEGAFDQANTLWPYTTVSYTAAADGALTDQSIYAVVRDRRGGMAWVEQKIRVP